MIPTKSISGSIEAVDGELKRIFDAKTVQSAASGPWLEHLWKAAASRALGGKLVRPCLFLDALKAMEEAPDTGTPQRIPARASIQLAAGLELLHYSFLLHDDVIDGDLNRRGEPNFIALLAASAAASSEDGSSEVGTRSTDDPKRLHWARSCAILMGDLLLAEVHQIFARIELEQDIRTRLFALLDHSITDSVVGEQLDIGLCDGVIGAELPIVLQMSVHKTATYSFELPLRAAAVLANADQQLELILAQTGQLLGLAFQLQDDLLSTFGDPQEHGKDAFSDLREGKETAVIAHARMTSCWPTIEPFFGQNSLSDADGTEVRALLVTCGAKAFVEGLIDDQLRALHELLADHNAVVPPPLCSVITQLCGHLEGRSA